MQPTVSESYFRGIVNDLADAVTHPEFLERMVALREASWEEKEALIPTIDIAEMQAKGTPIADHIRVSPRTFEKPEFAQINGVQAMGQVPGLIDDAAIAESYDTGTWGDEAAHLPMLMESPEMIRATMEIGFDQLIDYVMTHAFQTALADMVRTSDAERPAFVLATFLDPAERARRGIEPPPQMRLQRSTFRDGRPTLFCICILMPLAYPWRKLTFTFDNDIVEAARANPALGLALAAE